MVSLLSGRKVVHREGVHHHRYMAIGSILGAANSRAEVWGSGFIRADERVLEQPLAIHAVRGPMTRDSLRDQGIDCPEVYGDPALLLPRFFNPLVQRKYSIGIIPHYVDKDHPWVERQRNAPGVRVIDIESDIEEFVRAVLSCEVILSSSLHGLICADAYGLPATWIRLSNRLDGGSFKFRDYRQSIGASEPVPAQIDESTTLSAASRYATPEPLRIDLRKLLISFPLLRSDLKQELETAAADSCGLPESFASAQLSDVTGR
jgi:pyruvyltransferase